MDKRKDDLSMELYIIDYLGAFIVMLGGFIILIVSHAEEIIAHPLFSALLSLIH